jgi:N-acetylglucosaminyl-diphospho-decaprenol L-rhamnosyltransferase
MRTRLTTIVVNWNTVDLLDDCLRSIVESTPIDVDNEIIVVDNASADGSVAHLAASWPDVQVIVNAENVGFCRANNQAIRISTAPFLLLVNSDARLETDGIATLLGYFERDERAAVVGPRLVYGDGSFQRWTAGQSPRLRSMANYLLGIERMAPSRPRAGGLYLARDTASPFRPGWVSSAVMALRRTAVDEIGPLDERIFVYMDDVDICQRATDAGWNVWYAADTTATHFMGGSAKRATGRASPEALRALNRWFVRRHGRASGIALQALEVAGFGGRTAAYGAKAVLQRSPEARSQMTAHAAHLRLALEPIRV